MSLAQQPARRFRTPRAPHYPVALAAALLAGGACHPAPAPAGEPVAPYQGQGQGAPEVMVPPDGSGGRAAAAPPGTTGGQVLVVAAAHSRELGLEDARRAPRFAEDDAPLQLSEGSCRGDCAPPYESAAFRKDESQLRARAAWCTRAASARGPVPSATVTIRAAVGPDQVPRGAQLVPDAAPLPADLEACLGALVARARLTPPESRTERQLQIVLEVGRPK